MAETDYTWFPLTIVKAWLKKAGDGDDANLELCRLAAAEWVQDQRRDLFNEEGAFLATDRVVQAALLVVGRLWSRKDSPAGVVSFQELGAGSIVRHDPDIRRLLGIRPRVG